jgi:Zn-dependent peptidase ImmA (M78 family)
MPAKARKAARIRKSRKRTPWFTLPALYAAYPVTKVKTLKVKGDDAVAVCSMPPGDRRGIQLRVGNLTRDQQRVVLWHEAMHAIFHEAGLEANVDDEALCEMLAQAIMRIRKEVPWL